MSPTNTVPVGMDSASSQTFGAPLGATASPGPLAGIRFEGIRHTHRSTLEREVQARQGEVCDAQCVQEDLDRLDRLGAFADVSSRRDGDTLVYRFIELPLVVPVPNGRISDEEGISLGAGLKAPNLFGRAIAGEFLFLLGHSTEWQLNMGAPRVGPIPLGWELFTSRTDRWDEGRGYKELSYTSRALFQYPTNTALRGVGEFQLTQVGADRRGNTAAPITLSSDNVDRIPMLRLGILWDGRDRTSLTTRGLYQELSVKKSGEPLGGPIDSWEFLSDTRAWLPLSSRWGLHASHLLQIQTGRTGGWQTYVLGGANTVRGLPGNWAVEPSEEIGSLELRWTVRPARPVALWGANLYYGLQVIAGSDIGIAWRGGVERWLDDEAGAGIFTGLDIVVPFLERVRLVASQSPTGGHWTAGFAVGLFEKTVIERYRVR